MTRSLRLRLIAATLIIAVAPLLFLGLSMLTADRRAAEGQRHTTADSYSLLRSVLRVRNQRSRTRHL